MGVGGEQDQISIRRAPVDVGVLMTTGHHVPRLGELAVAMGSAHLSRDRRDPIRTLAADMSLCEKEGLQERADIAVADRRPVEGRLTRLCDGRGTTTPSATGAPGTRAAKLRETLEQLPRSRMSGSTPSLRNPAPPCQPDGTSQISSEAWGF